jgi:hypothetical protein
MATRDGNGQGKSWCGGEPISLLPLPRYTGWHPKSRETVRPLGGRPSPPPERSGPRGGGGPSDCQDSRKRLIGGGLRFVPGEARLRAAHRGTGRGRRHPGGTKSAASLESEASSEAASSLLRPRREPHRERPPGPLEFSPSAGARRDRPAGSGEVLRWRAFGPSMSSTASNANRSDHVPTVAASLPRQGGNASRACSTPWKPFRGCSR